MINLSNNILQIHYFGNKCMLKTEDGLIPMNEHISYLITLLNQKDNYSIEDLAKKFKSKFNIDATLKEIELVLENYIYNAKETKKLFCVSNRAKNDVEIISSGQQSRYVPYLLNIELTNVCNLNCSHCYKEANIYEHKNINVHDLKELFSFLNSKNLSITLTGGEPTMHPNFEEIVEYCFEFGNVDIVTNGINLFRVNSHIINRLNLIGISLYGVDNYTYYKNTGVLDGFDKLKKSINYLHLLNKEFIFSIVLDKEKIKQLEKYVLVAAEFGAKNLQIGLPSKVGKLIETNNDNKEWNLSDEDIKEAYRKIRSIQKNYNGKMKIMDWERDVYEKDSFYDDLSNPANFYSTRCMKCGAGTTQWTVSEDFMFRPCNLLMKDFIKILDFKQFKNYVEGYYTINWEKVMYQYQDIYSQSGYKLSDCCKRLTDFLYDKKV